MADQGDMLPSTTDVAPLGVGTEPGDTIGGYELLRELGRGGMAEVWLARRARATGKFVAIKMILPRFVGLERYSRMFATEAEVSAPLSHSNIVQVFDEGEDRGRSYLVMEWVDGVDLAQLLPRMAELRERDPRLRLGIAAYVVGQVLHGLSYAHRITSHRGRSLGIVHRDISPQNVLVSVSGDVKVTDFGIAHRMVEETSGFHVKGKLRYMAPEQLAGRSHEPTVDLYAVGAILHELLDGRKFLHDADDQLALYRRVMCGRMPELGATDVPTELDAVRRALLERDPSRRPQTADAAVLLLKRWPGYSEMRAELGRLCGLAIGVVRPRTGPIVEVGMPTVPPRSARSSSRMAAPAVEREPDAPGGQWGVLTEVLPAPFDGRDLEPTRSSIGAVVIGMVPGFDSTLEVAPSRPRRTRAPMLLAGFATLAVLGGIATAIVLGAAVPPGKVTLPSPPPQEIAPAVMVSAPEVEMPVLSPAPVAAPEPMPIPIVTAPAPEIAAPPTVARARRPTVRRSHAKPQRGPEVTVHVRLEGGLTGADLKLAGRVVPVRPRFDGRIAAGRHGARIRIAPTDRWRSIGTVEIGASGEWKLLIGPTGARAIRL